MKLRIGIMLVLRTMDGYTIQVNSPWNRFSLSIKNCVLTLGFKDAKRQKIWIEYRFNIIWHTESTKCSRSVYMVFPWHPWWSLPRRTAVKEGGDNAAMKRDSLWWKKQETKGILVVIVVLLSRYLVSRCLSWGYGSHRQVAKQNM